MLAMPAPRTLQRLLLLVATALVLIAQSVAVEYADPDLWGRIAVGAVLDQTGALPRFDDFSFTARGARWIDHEWLTGVVFYEVLAHGGEAWLVAFKHLLALVCVTLVFAIARLHAPSPLWPACALLLLSPVSLLGFITTLRAQLFTFAAFLLLLLALEALRLRRLRAGWLVLALPGFALWGNLHGGFVMGVLAIAIYAAAALVEGRRREALGLCALAAGGVLAVVLVNPYGPAYGAFLLHAWTLDRSLISEWAPMWSRGMGVFTSWAAGTALIASLLAIAGIRDAWRRRARGGAAAVATVLAPSGVLLLLVAMTLQAMRIQTFLAFALAALAPLYLDRRGVDAWPALRRRLEAWEPVLRRVIPAVAVLGGLGGLAHVGAQRPLLAARVPAAAPIGAPAYAVGAVRWLRHSPYTGGVLNPFTQGEFLLWTLYPKFRVGVDGRYEEVYGQQHIREAYRLVWGGAREWPAVREFIERSGAAFVLLPSRVPNKWRIAREPGWRRVYDDGSFSLLARRSVLARHPSYAGPPGRLRPRLTIGSYVTPADRRRFAYYPRRPSSDAGRPAAGASAAAPRATRPRSSRAR